MSDIHRSWFGVLSTLIVAGASLAYACSSSTDTPSGPTTPAGPKAMATIAPTSAMSTVKGTVEFADDGAETTVTIKISGTTPGLHAMHIHQNGNCDAIDGGGGLGAGGHWNPSDAAHGNPTDPAHHFGDLGNVTADATGNVMATVKSKDFYAKDGANTVVGHAVIFHADDDEFTQPVGNAGGRPGCGIITRVP